MKLVYDDGSARQHQPRGITEGTAVNDTTSMSLSPFYAGVTAISEDMGKVLAYCRAITRATGAMVVLVHHSGKDESKGKTESKDKGKAGKGKDEDPPTDKDWDPGKPITGEF